MAILLKFSFLQLDENGILLSSQNLQTFQQNQHVYQQSFSSLEQPFPNFQQNTSMLQQNIPMFHQNHLPLQQQQRQQQQPEPSSSLYAENAILKENIEKERLRRKVISPFCKTFVVLLSHMVIVLWNSEVQSFCRRGFNNSLILQNDCSAIYYFPFAKRQ